MPRITPVQYLRRLAACAGLLLCAVGALYGWQSWRTTKTEQIHQLETALELTEVAVDRYFMQMQAGLGGLATVVNLDDGPLDLGRVQRQLRGFHDRRPELSAIAFADRDGRILAVSTTTKTSHAGLLATSHLTRHPEILARFRPDRPIELGTPLLGDFSKRWVVPFDYAVFGRDGKVATVFVVALPVEVIEHFWSDAPIISKVRISLMRDDGYLVSRFPIPKEEDMSSTYGKRRNGAVYQFVAENNFPARGYVEGLNTAIQADMGSVFKRLRHFPLTLTVAMPMQEFRAAWWRRVQAPFALLLLLAVGGYLVYRYTLDRQRAWDAGQLAMAEELELRVARRTEQLRNLGAQLEAAESRERRKIARDLHDDLGQILAAARIRVSGLESDERDSVRKAAGEVGALIDRADRSTRALAAELAPPVLYELGLAPALEWLGEEMKRDFDLDVTVIDDGQPKPLSQEARLVLYRAVRELLINVAKHAGVESALVNCRREGNRVILNITDAGGGFDAETATAAPTRAMGLFGVRERLSFMGGDMRISSAPGSGTSVEVTAPVTSDTELERQA